MEEGKAKFFIRQVVRVLENGSVGTVLSPVLREMNTDTPDRIYIVGFTDDAGVQTDVLYCEDELVAF